MQSIIRNSSAPAECRVNTAALIAADERREEQTPPPLDPPPLTPPSSPTSHHAQPPLSAHCHWSSPSSVHIKTV